MSYPWSSQDVNSAPLYSMPSFRKQSRAAGKIQTWFMGQRAAVARRAAMGAPRRIRYLSRALGAPGQGYDTTVRILNTGPAMKTRIQRTVNQGLTQQFTNVNLAGGTALVFDPSGTFGNTSTALGPLAMSDWTSLIAVFNQYKVNKITVNFNYETQGALVGAVPLYINKNYERNVTAPTVAGLCALSNTVLKNFSPESSRYSYSFVPKCGFLLDNVGVIATEGRSVQNMPWTDVTLPVELFGLQFVGPYTLATSQFLFLDITYDVSFRYSK